jgi:hypothetical protein
VCNSALRHAIAPQRIRSLNHESIDGYGRFGGPVRPPLVNISPEEQAELGSILESWQSFLDSW